MKNSYAAIAKNKPGTFRKMELKKVVAKEVSSWQNSGFRSILKSLESFDMSLRGGVNGARSCMNTNDGYIGFVTLLDTVFMDHLDNVEHFRFEATDEGPVGLEGWPYSELLLCPQHMPKLKTMDLTYMFISPVLVEFLKSHSSSL